MLSSTLMFVALYYLAKFDIKSSFFIAVGAGIVTFLIPSSGDRK